MTQTTTPAVGNELFLHNMRALWRRDPELALLIDAVPDEERVELEPTRSGSWTARLPAPGGALTYLHSRYDPAAEAKRLAESIEIEDKFCIVVSGMGLGHHIRAILECLVGDAFILCTEPSIRLIATALTCVDLADALATDRLIILTDDDKSRLHDRLESHGALIMMGAQFVRHPASLRIAEAEHGRMTKAIAEFVAFTRMSLVTLVTNSKITCRNIAMNLVHYVTTPPIDGLKDRFEGLPGIVVSAGPSLARNIDELAKLKGRAVLCTVQTAIKPLMERGIVSDFVTSLDFHEMSTKYFEEVGDLSGTHLVAEPKATWHVIDRFPGPVTLLDNPWAHLLLGDELAARGSLKEGATVAHLAFYLAVHLGCNPIIFVGQDLAFTGHVFYIPGVEIHRAWRGELNRYCPMEQKEWNRIVRNRPILCRVPANDGGELYSDELLTTYLEQFEKDIAAVPQRVINATEGGARIRGAEVMTLREVAQRFCARSIDPERFAEGEVGPQRDEAPLAAARRELSRRIEELDGVIVLCEELIALLKELKGLTKDPARFNKRMARVDELRVKVQQESRAYEIVNAYSQLGELRRYSADRRTNAQQIDDVERAKRQIARDLDFMRDIRDNAAEIKPVLEEALARMLDGVNKV